MFTRQLMDLQPDFERVQSPPAKIRRQLSRDGLTHPPQRGIAILMRECITRPRPNITQKDSPLPFCAPSIHLNDNGRDCLRQFFNCSTAKLQRRNEPLPLKYHIGAQNRCRYGHRVHFG